MNTRSRWFRGRMAVPLLGGMAMAASFLAPGVAFAANQNAAPVTFTKNVAPILQQKCAGCHAPGEMAPMSLITFQQVRPWARSIRLKVSKREMPPWFIDKKVGIQTYKNDPSLTDEQIDTIVRWIDAGTPEGNPADMPKPAQTAKAEGWAIGTPDLIVKKRKVFSIYANGSDWWEQDTGDTGLTEDRWVKAVELKPGNRKIVHHFCGGPVAPGAGGAGAAGVGAVGPQDRYAQEEKEAAAQEVKLAGEGGGGAAAASAPATTASISGGGFGCYLPGNGARFFGDDTGVLLKAGSKLSFGMHYSASGEEGTDQSSIGLVFYPKGVTPKHVAKSSYFQKFPAFELDIPPNARTTSDAYMQLPRPSLLTSFTPHMHFRGNALVLEAILPTGRVITISGVEKYNFGWQIEYLYADDQAPLLPAGTMLHAIVVHDNTSANPFNPDPNRWVGYGQASIEEMAGTFVSWIELSPDEFRQRTSERRAAQRAAETQQEQ
jgi:hypothetical protein